MVDDLGRHCLAGALQAIDIKENSRLFFQARALIWEVLEAQYDTSCLSGWNDNKNRTLDDVIDVLDTAIEIAEVEEELV